jgi:hypothetical protein
LLPHAAKCQGLNNKLSVVASEEMSSERATTRGFWPPSCPYLNSCQYYLWRLMKVEFEAITPHSLEEL